MRSHWSLAPWGPRALGSGGGPGHNHKNKRVFCWPSGAGCVVPASRGDIFSWVRCRSLCHDPGGLAVGKQTRTRMARLQPPSSSLSQLAGRTEAVSSRRSTDHRGATWEAPAQADFEAASSHCPTLVFCHCRPLFPPPPTHTSSPAWQSLGSPGGLPSSSASCPFSYSLHPSQSDLISALGSLRRVHSCSHSSKSIHLSTYLFSKYFLRAWAEPGSVLSAKGLQWTGGCWVPLLELAPWWG